MWWQRLAFVLGLWLMAAPAVLGLPKPMADALHVLGPLAAAAGFIAASEVTRGMRWANLPIGAAVVVVAATFLEPPSVEMAAVAVSGVALACLAFAGGRTSASFGGGWRSLLR